MLCLNITRSDGSFKHKMSLHRKKLNVIITGRNEVVAKVMFVLVSVILLMGGGCYPSMHCRWYPACLAAGLQGGASSWGMPGLGDAWSGGCLVWGDAWSWGSALGGGLCGLLLWPSVIVFCFALLLWPSGVAFWYGLLVWCPSDCRRPSG